MRRLLYRSLRRNTIVVTLMVSFIPLFLVGTIIYYWFFSMYKDRIRDQITFRATINASVLDLFLEERRAILATILDSYSFDYIVKQENLSKVFEDINKRSSAWVDLGVIDSSGRHLAYIGPYHLKSLNYYHQPWFGKVLNKGIYISDVYLGYRQLPHFIIAVRRQEKGKTWIIRATIDSGVYEDLVRKAQTGTTGDAYIINTKNIYQTPPRFHSQILANSGLDGTLFAQGTTTVFEQTDSNGEKFLYAGRWLKQNQWLLITTQKSTEGIEKLLVARNKIIALLGAVGLSILLTTILTTNMSIKPLEEADRKMNELNAQLMQSDKLAALGKMAAGVAHEINNPLAVIDAKVGWMKDLMMDEDLQESKSFEEYEDALQKIEKHVETARKVIHSMLGFARRMEPYLEDVDINSVLQDTLDMLKNHALINNIDIQTDFDTNLPVIASDQGQLQQVFLNIVNNAIDAIQKEGTIRVKTERIKSDIAITIEDDGPGIPEEIQARIFDPFFSTKGKGRGVGLGLSVTYSIIEGFGGTITLKSKKGQGSTFTVTLPIVVPEHK